MEVLFAKDQWLSDCLGLNCYNLSNKQGISFDSLSGPLFVTAKVPVSNYQLDDELSKQGFRHINKQVTFVKSVLGGESAQVPPLLPDFRLEVRASLPEASRFSDLFAFDRFSTDAELPQNWSFIIKRKWLESVGANKQYILLYYKDIVVGFILFKIDTDCIIELVCVLEEFRGKNLAKVMLSYLQRIALENSIPNIIVGTQSANSNSMHVYRSFGFVLIYEAHVLHYTRGLKFND
jgi:GNAT superfamily N-acetyltransferase